LVAATLSFALLAALLLTMGFTDELRNVSLATPFLVLLLVERPERVVGVSREPALPAAV
jgi:hypothetical protein